MALISELTHQSIQHPKKHKHTTATYDVLTIEGETFLQITTYGTSEREFIGKASQIIQLDKTCLEQLKQILDTLP